jgi:hypothetical protein
VRRLAPLILLSFAFWVLVTLAFSAQLVFAASFPWREAVSISARDWIPWAVASPAVVWLAWRFPIERGTWPVSVPVHLAACVLVLALCGWLGDVVSGAISLQPRQGELPFPPRPEEGGPSRMRPPFGPGIGQPTFGGRGRGRPGAPLWMRPKLNFPVYWVVVSVAHAMMFYRRAQERERSTLELSSRLAESKLEALRLQLHPHFLFNTLNAISALIHKDPRAADDMIGNLSELLRLSLDVTEQEVPLRREIEFLDRYLEIERTRLGDRLETVKEIGDGALDALVPALVLQPLVENAIRHGIEPRREPGRVIIRVVREDGRLRLNVSDNGVGWSGGKTLRSGHGIGLANTTARLRELYGGTARMELRESPAGGLDVLVEIPFRAAHPGEAPPTKAVS